MEKVGDGRRVDSDLCVFTVAWRAQVNVLIARALAIVVTTALKRVGGWE